MPARPFLYTPYIVEPEKMEELQEQFRESDPGLKYKYRCAWGRGRGGGLPLPPR